MRLLAAVLLPLLLAAVASANAGEHSLPVDGTLVETFPIPGEYAFACRPHPKMIGAITVEEGLPATNETVRTVALQFEPTTLRVGPGSNVTFENEDGVFHTVTYKARETGGATPLAAPLAVLALAGGAALAIRRYH